MPDLALQRTALASGGTAAGESHTTHALRAGWREGLAIVNLRGDAGDPKFADAVHGALGMALPTTATTTRAQGALRLVWAGPDDWFVIGPKGQQHALADGLRGRLAGQHAAVTDVSSGYTVLTLTGTPASEVLAQGCPLDLHPRVFWPGHCAGTHWFKASVWLWASHGEPGFELLVRRSFMGYVWEMLERTTAECGLVARRFV